MSRAAMQQALEALEERYVGALRDKAIDALESALAEPEQEPLSLNNGRLTQYPDGSIGVGTPTPRKPLTEEETLAALVAVDPETKRLPPGFRAFARAIERAHGITGEQT